MLLKPKSIDDYGGMQPYLDDAAVRARHNGYGYDDLIKNRQQGPAFVRDLFGLKSRNTVYRWFQRLDQEASSDGKN